MSERLHQWSQFRERATGKWQIPVLLLALAALGLSLATYRSPASRLPFDDMRDELPELLEEEMYTATIESARILLQVPGKNARDLAPVYGSLARARLLRAERNGATIGTIGREVIEHYQHAVEGGFEFTPQDYVNLGKAYEWIGAFEAAVEHYESSMALFENPSLDLRWHVTKLYADKVPVSEVKLNEAIDALLSEAGKRPDILTWAAERKTELFCDADRCAQARVLLENLAPRLGENPWNQWLEYLKAYVSYRSGAFDEAEARLRLLRDGLTLRDELYARSGWLLGRVVLSDRGPQRPMEALTFFEPVMSSRASLIYAVAGELGVAESLVMLERFDDALDRYSGAISKLRRLPPTRVLDRGAIELSLTVASERLRRGGRAETALRFAEEAARLGTRQDIRRYTFLLERVAELKTAVARKKRAEADALAVHVGSMPRPTNLLPMQDTGVDVAPDSKAREKERTLLAEARKLFLESGDLYNEIASLTTRDEPRSSEAAWRGAERIHESRDHMATIAAMRRYIEMRPESPRVARALRLMGHAQQALGLYGDAIETYQENYRRFARTPDAGSSLIPLARCYIALGKKYADRAEKTLGIILDDSEVFTPSAPEYADALFLLGELLNRSGAYERAIPTLEEAMTRYPDDARRARAQFLLGDCYLQSGLALNQDIENASFAGQRQRLSEERKKRLRRAADLFGKMVEDYEARGPNTLTRLNRVYLRHARLSRADCHFELGEYEQSLAHYERAAWIHKGTTTALSAYVQIINCHMFTGNGAEASAALRRARYLVDTMPDESFQGQVELETRDDWRRYFAWVARSGLF